MAPGLSLRTMQSLVWETTYRNDSLYKESPYFYYMDSSWILTKLTTSSDSSLPPSTSYFYVYLTNISGIEFFLPFKVTTFLEDKRNYDQMPCSHLTIRRPNELLLRASIDEIHEKLPGLVLYNDINVVCTFLQCTGAALAM